MTEIETARLYLQPVQVGDIPQMAELWADPRVMRYLPGGRSRSLEAASNEVQNMITHWMTFSYGVWVVRSRREDEFMGYSGLQHFHNSRDSTAPNSGEINPDVEFLFGFRQKFWGQGAAVEAARASLRYGFQVAGVERIAAAIHPENGASRHILMKYLRMQPAPDLHYYECCPHFLITRKEYRADDTPFIVHQ
jgi:RimJ/RimL family protein N-acetyltransferase